jgi:hypothetical protein
MPPDTDFIRMTMLASCTNDRHRHVVYVHDLRWLLHHWPTVGGLPARPEERPLWSFGWPLGQEHMLRGPVLGAVLIDEREPPR